MQPKHAMPSTHALQSQTDTRVAIFVAAFASLAAGLIHLAVTPGHWQEWILSGVFFLSLAGFQLVWAGAISRFPNSWLVSLGLIANIASIALWGASRLWGVPVGPNAGAPEAVGPSGVLTVLLESILVVTALWFLLPREQSAVLATSSYRFALGGAAVIVVTLMAPGVAAGLEHDHGSHGHGHGGTHSDSGRKCDAGTHSKPGHHQNAPTPSEPSPGAKTSPAPKDAHPSQPGRNPTSDTSGDGHNHDHNH